MSQKNYIALCILLFLMPCFKAFSEEVVVPQHTLEKNLGCNTKPGQSICFVNAVKYIKNDLYVLEFRVKFDVEPKDIFKTIRLNMTQISIMLNPMTARHYGVKFPSSKIVDENIYPASDIVVFFQVMNRGEQYVSYIYPVEKEGATIIYSKIFVGDYSVLKLLEKGDFNDDYQPRQHRP
ncbi:hypothetical protein [Vibrio salinus]|uniref:hypothetical protein n=1 Tax=Vibrio salinus TaxID=2899784 RepID=UPI001E4CD947|nr:hypothetical protein [Vibrio salinus]MCE0494157.1 hypothetical protein [Vibrio salinus]